jgi:1-acyl-sn-glycerol-3-phosphate acyltransferase
VAEIVYTPVIGLARALFAGLGLRFSIEGTEHLPPTGGAVLAINHVGYLDFTFAGLAAQPAGRLVRFMAKESVFRHPVSGPLMRGMKHIPVDRASGAASYDAALRAVRAGEIIGLFPEATISRSFEIKNFKNGAVRLAQAGGVPLIPVLIWGSQRVWTKGRPRDFGRRRYPISITVDEPLELHRDDSPDALTEQLRARMVERLAQVRQAYPGQPRDDADRWWLPASMGGTAPTPAEAAELDAAEAAERRADAGRGST